MSSNIINKFCVVGNSHLNQFDDGPYHRLYGYGASICGLTNENSTLKLKQKVLEYQQENPDKTLVFFLGQSDVEFIYYFRSIKQIQKLDINEFIDTLTTNYVEFLKEYIKKPIVLGINPTVIKNNIHIFNVNFRDSQAKELNNPTGTYSHIDYEDVKEFYDDFKTRFAYSLLFNKVLKDKCEANKIIYIDINDEVLDEDGNVKEIYKPSVDDHHLQRSPLLYQALIRKVSNYV